MSAHDCADCRRLIEEAKAEALSDMANELMRAHDVGPARRCRNRAASHRARADAPEAEG